MIFFAIRTNLELSQYDNSYNYIILLHRLHNSIIVLQPFRDMEAYIYIFSLLLLHEVSLFLLIQSLNNVS